MRLRPPGHCCASAAPEPVNGTRRIARSESKIRRIVSLQKATVQKRLGYPSRNKCEVNELCKPPAAHVRVNRDRRETELFAPLLLQLLRAPVHVGAHHLGQVLDLVLEEVVGV